MPGLTRLDLLDGNEFDAWNDIRGSRSAPIFLAAPTSLTTIRLPARKEVFRLENFLMCTNPKCRFIVNLREGAQVLERSKIVIDECPECGSKWSSYCPFCEQPLEVVCRGGLSFCVRCNRSLQPEGQAD